jgi:hypothetical protein
MRSLGIGALFCGLVLGAPFPARAVIVAAGDGVENTTPPPNDPGWVNVGQPTGGLTVIYLGNGWVLTANHVGAGSVILAGQTYEKVAGSEHRLLNPDSTPADLLLFQIQGNPPLPPLRISPVSPAANTAVTMIGNGVNRGSATSWMGIEGFLWGNGSAMRWGTNLVSKNGIDLSLDGSVTRSFSTDFSGGTAYEAQAAVGDSGGAVFFEYYGEWVLGGVMIAISDYYGQPEGTALLGNLTYAADLSYYRDQISQIVVGPSCGLGFELVGIVPMLEGLRQRRRRLAMRARTAS